MYISDLIAAFFKLCGSTTENFIMNFTKKCIIDDSQLIPEKETERIQVLFQT